MVRTRLGLKALAALALACAMPIAAYADATVQLRVVAPTEDPTSLDQLTKDPIAVPPTGIQLGAAGASGSANYSTGTLTTRGQYGFSTQPGSGEATSTINATFLFLPESSYGGTAYLDYEFTASIGGAFGNDPGEGANSIAELEIAIATPAGSTTRRIIISSGPCPTSSDPSVVIECQSAATLATSNTGAIPIDIQPGAIVVNLTAHSLSEGISAESSADAEFYLRLPRGVYISDGGALVSEFLSQAVPLSTPKLKSLVVTPSYVAGCKSAIGTVQLTKPAPAGGTVVTLSDDMNNVSVPPSVKVPKGATSATFTVTTTPVEGEPQLGRITARLGTANLSYPFTIGPVDVASLTLTPNPAVGSTGVMGTVTLECPATIYNVGITLSSSNPEIAPIAPDVSVPQGQQSATFLITTTPVLQNETVTISAERFSVIDATLTLTPASFVAPASLAFGKVSVGRTSKAKTVTLTNKGAAPFNVSGVALTGTGAGSFVAQNNCPGSLAASSSCTIDVSFSPTAGGTASARLLVTTSATSEPQSVSLSGTGVAR